MMLTQNPTQGKSCLSQGQVWIYKLEKVNSGEKGGGINVYCIFKFVFDV